LQILLIVIPVYGFRQGGDRQTASSEIITMTGMIMPLKIPVTPTDACPVHDVKDNCIFIDDLCKLSASMPDIYRVLPPES
jgi:hypothetical protein